MSKVLKVKCPHCHAVFSYYDSEFRPFCSERCKMIDLGHWFEESYTVPEKEVVKTVEKKNEKSANEKNSKENEKENQEIENQSETSYDDYVPIDEDNFDENDY